MKVDIHQADARGNVLTTLAGTRIVFRGKRLRVPAAGGHPRLQRPQLLLHPDQRLKNAFQRFLDRFLSGQVALLGQVSQPEALLDADLALVRGFLPGDDLHQGALSAAVHPDQAHALPVLQGKRNLLQHLVGAEALLYVLHGQNNHASLTDGSV